MGRDTVGSLRDRMAPPPARAPAAPARAERVLRVAADLFDVAVAALVLTGPEGLEVAGTFARADWNRHEAIETARVLLETVAAGPGGGGVLEHVVPGRGFRAAALVADAEGRGVGVVCLLDPDRRALLSGLQRRLLAEFGGLFAAGAAASGRAAEPDRHRASRGRAA